MSVLESAKQWANQNLIDDDTLALLLVGSWARGIETDPNDIDLLVIKQFQLVGIVHHEHKQAEFTLDGWVHDKDALQSELFEPAEDLNKLNNISMIVTALKDAVIWYEKEPFITEYIEKAKNWSWNPEYTKFLQFESEPPSSDWARQAYQENLQLLDAARNRLHEGKPIAYRRKDYPELVDKDDEGLAREALDLTNKAYESLGIDRSWSEFSDAKKAFATGQWADCISSLKDVLRFIIRYELPAVPDQLLDPRIWKETDGMTLSDPIKSALVKIYG
ncbi:MAG: hypothetical protein ACXAB7_06345 [Candidatus Kariarchaeaceae archaeon]|jgi:hypothetical protein